MWRFYGRLARRLPDLLWGSASLLEKITGVVSLCLSVVGVTAWWPFSPLWALLPIFLFLLYGLMKANYEAFQKIKAEKDALEKQIETDEKRAAIGEGLADLYYEGITLRAEIMDSTDETPVSECNERLLEWRRSVADYVEENVSIGKAQYVDGVTSVPAVRRRGMKSSATRNEKEAIVSHLEERLARLAEVTKEY